jgi:hypothetical protein
MTPWQSGFVVGYLVGLACGWSVTVQAQALFRELKRDRATRAAKVGGDRAAKPLPEPAGLREPHDCR